MKDNTRQCLYIYISIALLCLSFYFISHLGILFDNVYFAIIGIVSCYIIIFGVLVKEKFYS
jgi:hypothetical protein